MLHLSLHRGHIQLEILIKSRLGRLIAFDQMLAELLVEAPMKDHDEAGQLFVKRGSASPQTDYVEARADALLQKHVWQGFLGVHLLFQNPREALLRHLINNLLFSLEELEEDGDYL
jgi:hypothetical protein